MVGWLILAFLAVIVVSHVMIIAGTFGRSRTSWAVAAIRLRYLAWAALFLVLGSYLIINGVVDGWGWGAIAGGALCLCMGAVWWYARGGIGPGFGTDFSGQAPDRHELTSKGGYDQTDG